MGISQKAPFANSINSFVNRKIKDNQQSLGQALPCHVVAIKDNMVTVNFDVLPGNLTIPPVTCPVAESKYMRLPIQINDKGICISANARLGELSGLGLGKAPLVQPSNLGALVFVPISDTKWEKIDNNAANISGLNGVVLRDSNNKCILTLNTTGVYVTIGNVTFRVTAAGVVVIGNLQVTGSISADTISAQGIGLTTHLHGGVQRGGGVTDLPRAG